MPSTDSPQVPGEQPQLSAEAQKQVDDLMGRLNEPKVVQAKAEGTEVAVTSAKDWRRKRTEGIIVTLPSGNTAKIVRKMDIVEMLRGGQLPNSLATIVMSMMSGDSTAIEALELDQTVLIDMMDWINDQVIAAMVEPKVVRRPVTVDGNEKEILERAGWVFDAQFNEWDPPEGSVEIVDIEMQDRMFICGITQGGPANYDSFRAQSAAALEAAQRGQGVQPAS